MRGTSQKKDDERTLTFYVTGWKPEDRSRFVAVSVDFIRNGLKKMDVYDYAVLSVIAAYQVAPSPYIAKVAIKHVARQANISRNRVKRSISNLIQMGYLEALSDGEWLVKPQYVRPADSVQGEYCWKCGTEGDGVLEEFAVSQTIAWVCPTCNKKHLKGSQRLYAIDDTWAVSKGGMRTPPRGSPQDPRWSSQEPLGGSSGTPIKEREEVALKKGMEEAKPSNQPPLKSKTEEPTATNYCPEESRYEEGPVEPPSFITSPDQLIPSRIYKAVEECREILENQVVLANKIGNPLLKRSFFLKMKYPLSYHVSWAPLGHEALFARTILLHATNIMVEAQQKLGSPVAIVPMSAKEVEVLGDTLNSFLSKPTWAPRFRSFLTWVTENKTNWSINMLGYYVGDWLNTL